MSIRQNIVSFLQRIGKALMVPVAVLPALGIILRISSPDMLDIAVLASAGNAAFSNLPILFAVGIGFGIADDNNGAGGLSALIGYYILTEVANTFAGNLNPVAGEVAALSGEKIIEMSTFGGIIAGIIGGMTYNKFKNIKLPEFLGFFSGRRFVPIMTSFLCILFGLIFGTIWPYIQQSLDKFGEVILSLGCIGTGIFGFLNRFLIPFGLHHILTTFFWFNLGSFEGPLGVVTGDIVRFASGDPTAGIYQAGFFPIMMFGIPGALLAIYKCANPEKKYKILGFIFSLGLTSFLTGITEPFEFTFIFLSPLLYFIHAILTGLSMAIVTYLGCKMGFYFSASAIDFAFNFGLATKPYIILFVGVGMFFIYYFLFFVFIKAFDIKTIGREEDDVVIKNKLKVGSSEDNIELVKLYVKHLGGIKNILSVDACMTRIRCVLNDDDIINIDEIKKIGAKGVVKIGNKNVQIIVGTVADSLCSDIKAYINKKSS